MIQTLWGLEEDIVVYLLTKQNKWFWITNKQIEMRNRRGTNVKYQV